jgi:hypothetical protein
VTKKYADGEDIGFVGEVTDVDPKILFDMLEKDYLPIVAPLGMDEDFNTYNINADEAASAIAQLGYEQHGETQRGADCEQQIKAQVQRPAQPEQEQEQPSMEVTPVNDAGPQLTQEPSITSATIAVDPNPVPPVQPSRRRVEKKATVAPVVE